MWTRTSEYALRAVIHLTQNCGDWPIPGNQIAEKAGIPSKYLSKVLGDLVRIGLLSSSRGKHGGFGLARSPKEIRLIDILEPFEQFEPRRCPFGNRLCSDEEPCLAHEEWKSIVESEEVFLRTKTVYDVAVKQERDETRE
ncbi:MAG: RrF2 family transcriptional regulator [Phycisphaerae bacterium]